MNSSKTDSVPEHELTQYLLGNLPEGQCERLDELSIADDEFADRLCAVENELVDAYVRDQLRGNALRDFESHYLATDVRRKKVAMARTLFVAGARLDSNAEPELLMARRHAGAAAKQVSVMWLLRPRFAWLAGAAVLVLSVTAVWLAVDNHRLRQQNQASLAANSALQEEFRQLRPPLQNEPIPEDSPTLADGNGPRDMGHPTRLIRSIFLLPPTRGAAAIPVASVGQKDRWLRLQLALESNDFSQYQVDLLDIVSNKYVWHSGRVDSVEINRRRALSMLLPVGGLKPQRYAAEVNGIAADGRHEALGSYVFSIAQATRSQNEGR
jgi:hypothetical protein